LVKRHKTLASLDRHKGHWGWSYAVNNPVNLTDRSSRGSRGSNGENFQKNFTLH